MLPLLCFNLVSHSARFDIPSAKPRTLVASDLSAFNWRSIGPANMGGRVADIEFAPGTTKTFFVALATGGLWKTENRGTSFEPIFDKEATSSVGSVGICDAPDDWQGWKAESNVATKDRVKLGKAKIIWVGTGEGNGRNSSSWGNGMYRSTDGGKTFKSIGLEDSKDIPRLAVDPSHPDTCFAAALGHLWGPNKMRGIYRTTDAGKTWTPVLQLSDKAGAVDIILDPHQPKTIFAAMYSRLRTPWSLQSGGPEGGVYRSRDGGDHWKKLTDGLPIETGRIGLSISASNPKVVMAVVESDVDGPVGGLEDDRSHQGGVFRSEDGGDHWKRVNATTPRPFYFSKIKIDPKDDKCVYMVGWGIQRSEDGGYTFQNGVSAGLHSDFHAIAIDPNDTDHIVAGCDGGIFQTDDRAKTWDYLNNLAIGEFYNVAVDNSDPYRVMGGLQDNGSWIGPSSSSKDQGGLGILKDFWYTVGGGDGFHVAFDPTDSNVVYTESQGGSLGRLNLKTNDSKNIQPSPKEGHIGYRFNWNSPFLVSHFDSTVLYLGGNVLFKLTHKGDSWEAISPDLTTKNPDRMSTTGSNAETYCTVVALAESPVKQGVLWTGSDDGLIQMTSDEGKSWSNVTPKEVNGKYVAMVVASGASADRAYAAIDGHRSEDYDPMILETDNRGKSWRSITGDLPKGASVRGLYEDPTNHDLLYAGTENGAYLSVDNGQHWLKLNDRGLPTVGVHDFAVQLPSHDLVAATHGRSIWIMDDLSPLEQFTPKIAEEALHVFSPEPGAPKFRGWLSGFEGNRYFAGKNPQLGGKLDYWMTAAIGGVSISIKDAQGTEVATLTGTGSAGFNRVFWDFRPKSDLRVPNRGEDPGQVFVAPGKYTVTVTAGKETQTVTWTVGPSPSGAMLPPPPSEQTPD